MADMSRSRLLRLKRSLATVVVLVALAVIPTIYGGGFIWSNIDPTHRLDNVPAAIVNLDEPVQTTGSDGQKTTVAVGRLVTSQLVTSRSNQNLHWTMTSARKAEEGLRDGDFLAVLTIPRTFSAAASSLGGDADDASAAQMSLQTNDGANFLMGTIAKNVTAAVTEATSHQVSQTYLRGIYGGFNTMGSSLDAAADGAGQLDDGAAKLAAGTSQVANGSTALADGSARLSSGTSQLASGASEVAKGSSTLAGATGTLSSGASTLASSAGKLATATSALPSQTAALADGASQVSSGSSQLATKLDTLSTGAGSVAAGAGTLATSVDGYTSAVAQLAASCSAAGGSETFCANLAAVAAKNGNLNALATGVSAGAGKVSDGATAATQGAQQLSAGASKVSTGADQLAGGSKQLASSVTQLSGGAEQLASGAQKVATGSSSLASGAAKVDDGAESAASGAEQLADGSKQLADGAGDANSGARQVASGAGQLSTKLADGAKQVPRYSDQQKDTLSEVAADPVRFTPKRVHEVDSYGAGLAPYFLALALWVGGMATFMIRKALPDRAIASNAPAWRVVLSGLLPGILLSLVQSALLVGVAWKWIGVDIARAPVMFGLALLASVTFMAMNQACIAVFGTRGRFLALILTVVQLTAAGATYPIQTTPAFFQTIHAWLPVTYAVEGFRSAIAGGNLGIHLAVIALVSWLVGSLAVSIAAAKKKRMWTVERLHPSLQL